MTALGSSPERRFLLFDPKAIVQDRTSILQEARLDTSKNRHLPERSRPERGEVLVEDGDVGGCVVGRWFLAPFG